MVNYFSCKEKQIFKNHDMEIATILKRKCEDYTQSIYGLTHNHSSQWLLIGYKNYQTLTRVINHKHPPHKT